jgi:hypothetical protein
MGIVGEETTNEIFREYYRKWAFRHPSGKDFVNIVNEVVTRIHGNKLGPDLNWFFDQTLYGTGVCDYKVDNFYNSRVTDYTGIVNDGDSVLFKKSEKEKDTIYTATVQLERIGEVMLPVEVLIHFDNGDQILETWVKIDPDYKIKMDVNYINNSMTLNPDRKPVGHITNKFIFIMEFFINLISL